MEACEEVEAGSRHTAFERPRHGVGNASEVAAWHPDLGADGHVGRFEPLQHTAEILFRFAVAVLHRGVEVVRAGVDRPRDGALLVERIAAHHESADRAAAEAQHRELQSGAPEQPQFHRRPSVRMLGSRALLERASLAAATTAKVSAAGRPWRTRNEPKPRPRYNHNPAPSARRNRTSNPLPPPIPSPPDPPPQ